MTRLVAALATFIFLFVAHANVAMAFVMEMSESMHAHHAMMDMNMSEDDDCCDTIEEPTDCQKNNHECCFAPAPTTTITANVNAQKKEKKQFLTESIGRILFGQSQKSEQLRDQYVSDSSPP